MYNSIKTVNIHNIKHQPVSTFNNITIPRSTSVGSAYIVTGSPKFDDSPGTIQKLSITKSPFFGDQFACQLMFSTDSTGEIKNILDYVFHKLSANEQLLIKNKFPNGFIASFPESTGLKLTGSSYGAPFAVALMSLFKNKKVRDNVIMTGCVRNGKIIKIGGLICKLKAVSAVSNISKQTLILPRDNAFEYQYFIARHPELRNIHVQFISTLDELFRLTLI